MEELYLNGQRVDIEPEEISQTLQVNDLNDLKSRQANYTNSFDLPMTAKNILALQFLGVYGNVSEVPYTKLNADLFDSGLHLIRNGSARIKETKGVYKCYIYSNNYSLFEVFSRYTMQDLDYPELQAILDGGGSSGKDLLLNNTSGLIFPILESSEPANIIDGGAFSDYYVDNSFRFEPVYFLHTIWERMFEFAGLTYSGAIFSDAIFLNKVYTFSGGQGSTASTAKEMATEETMFTLISEVAKLFGLVYRQTGEFSFEFQVLSDLFETTPVDWTSKLVAKVSESYDVGNYAQLNKIEYNYVNESDKPLDWSIGIDNAWLTREKSLFKSTFSYNEILSDVGISDLIQRNIMYEDGTYKRVPACIYTLERKEHDIRLYGAGTANFTTNIPFLTTNQLDGEYIAKEFYPNVVRTLNRGKKVDLLLNLSLVDVININFFELKHFDGIGICYLNKIKNFKKNKPTLCELVVVNTSYDYDFDNEYTITPPSIPTASFTDAVLTVAETIGAEPPYPGSFEITSTIANNTSSDSNGEDLTYNWIKVSSPTAYTFEILDVDKKSVKLSGSDPTGAGTLPGAYVVKLIVKNESGKYSETLLTVNVT